MIEHARFGARAALFACLVYWAAQFAVGGTLGIAGGLASACAAGSFLPGIAAHLSAVLEGVCVTLVGLLWQE